MANFRSSRSILTRSPKRRTSWEVGPETGTSGSPQLLSSTVAQLATTAVATAIDSLTQVRLRGELVINLLTAAAQGDGFHGAFGIAKATTAAVVAGIASLPQLITEEAWDGWLYFRYFSVLSGGIIAQGVSADEDIVNSVTAALRVEVDSKAMRKFDINESLFAAIEVVEIGTATANWSFNCRTLVKDML